jgi:hypothetical protein
MTSRRRYLRTTGRHQGERGRWRATTLGLVGSGAALVLTAALGRDLLTTLPSLPSPVAVGDGVGVVAQLLGVVTAVVLGAVLLLGAVAAAPTRTGRALHRHGPRWVVRTAALLVVLTGTGPMATAAGAGTAVDPADPRSQAVAEVALPTWDRPVTVAGGPVGAPVPSWEPPLVEGGSGVEEPPLPGWRPTTPSVRPAPAADLVSRGRAPDHTVVVRRGDTLWDIAAQHLGPTATAEEIAREWPRWHAANREVIGSDPDLILPGQRLVAPAAADVVGDLS